MARQPDIQYINAYVSGSMAYQLERKPEKKQVQLPKMRRKKRMVVRIDPVAVLGIMAAAVLLVALCVGFFRLQDARAETVSLRNYVAELQSEKQQLQASYEAGYDLDEVERIALAMGMVPVDQLESVDISVFVPQKAEEPTGWENFRSFLAGLFA
jgi:hypothetical protein